MKPCYRAKSTARILPLLVLAVALLSSACAQLAPPRPTLPNMIWPEPPEIPRVALINLVHRPEDLGIRPSLMRRFWSGLIGQAAPEIGAPHGLTTDRAGRLYVVDKVLRQVHVFDEQGEGYHLIPESGPPLLAPIDVAVDERRGRIFVSDAEDRVVRIFSEEGAPIGEIRRGLLGRPTGLAINTVTDELLVIDTEHAALLRFSLKDLQLQKLIGRQGEGGGLFNAPTAVAAAPDGSILVVDTLNHRVQILDAEGRFVLSFGTAGDAPGFFARPKGVAVDSQGNIHVVDSLFDNVQVFDREGQLLMAYAEPGHKPGRLWLPSGIAIDGRGRIYVADTYNRRVQVFQFLEGGDLPE